MGRAEDLFQRIKDEGERAIDQFILDRQSEELFLDFKRSKDSGSGNNLDQNDRQNLAKAISGFGNSEGGIIVWGVDCRNIAVTGDVASAKVPIQNPKRFKSWLENTVSGCTVPPHTGVIHEVIEQSKGLAGFVATLIPKSHLAPHQCLKPLQYYIRAGSNFVPTPHSVLQGMFGRRPNPYIFNMWTLGDIKVQDRKFGEVLVFQVGFQIYNKSPVVVRDIYINALLNPPGENVQISVDVTDKANWTGHLAFGRFTSIVTVDSFKLAPEALIQPIVFNVWLVPPFEKPFIYKISFGCSGSPINKLIHEVDPVALRKAYDKFLRDKREKDIEEAETNFFEIFIGPQGNLPELIHY